MRTIAITNQKGGCGKTTVSINLSACLAQEERRVLLVDMDPQGHCALGLAIPEDKITLSTADVLIGDMPDGPVQPDQAIWHVSNNFDLLPATLSLVRFESTVANVQHRDLHLRWALEPLADRYDYCIIDCPPHVGLLTYNALRACEEAIVPVETGYFSLQGLVKQLQTIEDLIARTGEHIKISVLANSYDVRTKLAREILNEMRKRYDHLMLKSYVNFNAKLKEGASVGQSIIEYDSASMGYRDFSRLARELIDNEEEDAVHETLLLQADQLAARAEALLAGRSVLSRAERSSSNATATLAQKVTYIPKSVGEKNGDDHYHTDHDEISRKINEIYQIRQTDLGTEFNTNIPNASEVLLAGDFNNWSPKETPMSRLGSNGHFQAVLPLSPGKYRYRLVVDGRWIQDPCNQQMEVNEFGERISVVEIP